jgi:squalene synthase HpnC
MSAFARPTEASLPSRTAVMEQAEHENFTVASVVLGRRRQQHLLAIYGFARLVDDIGDEADGDRDALLGEVERQLDAIYEGEAPDHPVMRTLAVTIRECELPASPFKRLIEANRRDQLVTRYETFDELLGYCQLSAAPVGELVLGVFGAATPARVALSDRICAGLQIIEHLQDVQEDYARGRVYMPREDLVRFGCAEEELAGPTASEARRTVMLFEAGRARALLHDGAPLARTLPVRPRVAVAGFVAGGRAALEALERSHHDAIDAPRTRRRAAFALAFGQAAMGR